ncbi:MAG: TlpA disulfide reductase family protein [Bacteroidales bacterium]|jgi:thiol-disulfide isomerase/thioredoxin
MKRAFLNICVLCGVLLAVLVCKAESVAVSAKIIIDNPLQGSFLIGEIRGKDGFRANLWNSAGKQTVIELNEKVLATNKLFLVFFDNAISWIKIYPGDEIVVSQKDGFIVTKGGNIKINQYLAKWTKQSYTGCPSSLLIRTAVMELAGVGYIQNSYNADDYCNSSTVAYIRDLYDKNIVDLKSSGITDKEFLDDQTKRIKFQWIELILSNYNSSEDNVKATHLSSLIKNHNLNDMWLLEYPGLVDMLGFYIKLKIKEGAIKIGAKSFLVDQASVFALPEMKEIYILIELENIDRNRWYLFIEQTLDLTSPYVVSEGGRALLNKYRDNARKFINSETNLNNKPALNFTFDDKKHKKVNLSDFRGKYVVIDIWATWCGPCKYQIPFLVKMEKAFHGKNVQFISVSVDKPQDRDTWIMYIEANDMDGICLITPNALDFDFARKYSINAIPRFMIIGPDGEMIASEFRRPHDPVFKAQLEFLLFKKVSLNNKQ